MKIGYARVSTQDQNLNRQLDQLRQEGCERIYEEKISRTSSWPDGGRRCMRIRSIEKADNLRL